MFIKPSEILNQIDLKPEMVIADFGAGSGGWSIPVAKIVDEGKVWALDILEEPLLILKEKAQKENILNIQTKKVNLEKEKGSGLKDESIDFIIISNILFQIDLKKEIIKEAKRIIKKNGYILIIDWKKHDKFGPESNQIIPLKEIKKIIEEIGLKFDKDLDIGVYHYGLLFKKP